MLTFLKISNYALIDNLEISFKKGFSIITGETGAGKSIMMGALSVILGDKADSRVIRDANKKSVIEAVFDINEYGLKWIFDENGIEYFGDECILRREIYSTGRSRAFINDTPVSLSVLRGLSLHLIDIHSQHSNLLLSKHKYQLSILDSIISDRHLLGTYKEVYIRYKTIKDRLDSLKKTNNERKNEEEYIRFQLNQIKEIKLKENEDVELEAEEKKLSNITEIKNALWQAEQILGGEEHSTITDLSNVSQGLLRINGMLDEAEDLKMRLDSVIIEVKDITRSIYIAQENLTDNPQELERVQDRLNSIYTLETKHNAAGVNELIEIGENFEAQLAEIDYSENEINELEKKLTEQTKRTQELAKMLSNQRKKAAEVFINELKRVAIPLGMKNLRFEIRFENEPMNQDGSDAITFLFSFNKQQQLMPVETTASGGEISRLMLCIKSIIAESMKLPTIIFDEVDTGVSGDIANKMGDLMKKISSKIQVITITHLPQVAAQGENHFKVYKQDNEKTTYTLIKELSIEDRINEIASMLSGEVVDDAAINNAKSLLRIK